jgi:hypothetical protein
MSIKFLKVFYYFTIVAFFLVLIDSCTKSPQSTVTKGNDIQVEYMFEQDSVKVYRFMDNGNYHYFTTRGETMSTKSTGKTSRQENIQ